MGPAKIVGRGPTRSATIECVSTQFDLETPVHTGGWRVLAPFRFREYRLLITAVSISIFATGMWAVVMALQVMAIDDDPASLSLVAACMGVGMVAFLLVGGIAADRFPQRTIIIVVETVNFAAVTAVAVLGVAGSLRLWHMAVAAACLGVAAAFFFPAYSAYLPRILPAEQLLAANGIEGVVRPTLQQAIGPAFAGVLVGATFPTLGAVIVAVLYGTGLALLVATRPVSQPFLDDESHKKPNVLSDLRDGFLFMLRTPWLLATLLFASGFVLLVIGPIEVLLPFITTARFETVSGYTVSYCGLRGRRSAGRTCRVVGSTSAALHDGDDALLGAGKSAAGGAGLLVVVPVDGRGRLPHRYDRQRGLGHLGHAVAAAGTAGNARPGVEPGLLCVTGVHAGVDGRGRPAVQGDFGRDDFLGGGCDSVRTGRGRVRLGTDGA